MKLVRVYENRSGLATFFIAWFLFGIKVTVIGVAGSDRNGMRLDDVMLGAYFMVLLVQYSIKLWMPKAVWFYAIYVIVSSASLVLNILLGNVGISGGLFVFRLFEYLVFFSVGLCVEEDEAFLRLVPLYTCFLFVLMIAQMWGLLEFGYSFERRPAGNLGGPYEAGMVAAFLVFFHLYRKQFLLLIPSFGCLILSGSRIMLVAVMAVIFYYYFWKRSKLKALAILGFVILVLMIANVETVQRALGFFTLKNFEAIPKIIEKTTGSLLTKEGYYSATYTNLDIESLARTGDASFLIRVLRWSYLLRIMLISPYALFIGLGPSYASFAVDGFWVRVFVETGFIGLAVFLAAVRALLRSAWMKCWNLDKYLIALCLGGFFLDTMVTFKPMMLLWLFSGLAYKKFHLESEGLR